MRYDRRALQAAARGKGHKNSRQMAIALGIKEATAYRLWRGIGIPSAATCARIEFGYGISATALLKPRTAEQTSVPA